jgi:chromosome segregation protein
LPVSFARLRIAGFKSFAEPATVEILPGLTGIVGPNGCGKSNVVEALRWAMGENSARTMRGTEMDDVIFAGTGARASRNIAEVTLRLEDAAGLVPPPFHEHAELEVSRRIERGNGSAYRVNGKEIRARDVQTLFADLASGARSSAMVSQGRVAAIVGARPEDRRSVLEEAAGITGLHARRHEAELKLRAAEANLGRAEDLRGQLETQLAGLKRQARQASRYRNISGAVRQAESELLALQRARVEAARAAAKAALHDAGMAVAAATEAATAATAQATDLAAELPALRESEAVARTALERHRLAQEQIAAEEARARAALAEAERRLAVLSNDFAHAERACRDAEAAATRLDAEAAVLAAQAAAHPAAQEAAESACAEADEAVRAAEAAANRATDAAAQAAAASQAALQARQAAEQRARRIGELTAQTEREHAGLLPQAVDAAALAAAEAAQLAAETALAEARTALDQAEQARAAAQTTLAAARERQAAAASARAGLAAEARALSEVLAVQDNEQWPPMVDALGVPPGLEAALGAALGEELSSAADPGAARHWRELPAISPEAALPAGGTKLAALVEGPPALSRALSQIGLVEDDAAGDAAQPALAPGQMLVSRGGAVWRWDGYTILAGTPTAAAIRLQQRNRLRELRASLAVAERDAAAAEAARAEAAAADTAAVQEEQRARLARRQAEQTFEQARTDGAKLKAQADRVAARLAALADQLARQQAERAEADAALVAAQDAAASLPDLAMLRAALEDARRMLGAARSRDAAARAAADGLRREQAARIARRDAVARERADWTARAADATARAADLAARRTAAAAELDGLRAAPAEIASRRVDALDTLEAAEAAHRVAGDALTQATSRAAAADRAARAAEQRLATAREDAVRAEGAATQADHDWGTVAERILERLGVDPALPDPPADLSAEAEDKARRRLERLLREREEMGPVNLRADVEAEAVEAQMATIVAERDELTAAIAKLRGSIGHLNREGRERLSAVFQDIDRHFQALFSRVFGGGRAHLALVGSDDPLLAGLEIYAQPPGKKLATLSLLSGGEQALTALSLIFAVFRCNPAPICVLDEVDAPLDDANVDRFCTLLEDLVRESATRFLVVTHHPLTMARMDRLYGVTMQERGVSRLLSVDLQTAAGIVEPPRMAAE